MNHGALLLTKHLCETLPTNTNFVIFFLKMIFLHDERKDIKTITTAVQLMIDADRYLVRSY